MHCITGSRYPNAIALLPPQQVKFAPIVTDFKIEHLLGGTCDMVTISTQISKTLRTCIFSDCVFSE